MRHCRSGVLRQTAVSDRQCCRPHMLTGDSRDVSCAVSGISFGHSNLHGLNDVFVYCKTQYAVTSANKGDIRHVLTRPSARTTQLTLGNVVAAAGLSCTSVLNVHPTCAPPAEPLPLFTSTSDAHADAQNKQDGTKVGLVATHLMPCNVKVTARLSCPYYDKCRMWSWLAMLIIPCQSMAVPPKARVAIKSRGMPLLKPSFNCFVPSVYLMSIVRRSLLKS